MKGVYSEVIRAAAATVLLVSAALKIFHLEAVARTAVQLFPSFIDSRRRVAIALVVLEFALAVVGLPLGGRIVGAAVIGAGIVFAVAGVVAMRIPEPIRCNCFGALTDTRLGSAQLAAFPLWGLVGWAALQDVSALRVLLIGLLASNAWLVVLVRIRRSRSASVRRAVDPKRSYSMAG